MVRQNIMAKRGPNEAELDALNEQMKSLRKKLKKFTRAAAKEIIEPTAADTVDEACVDNKENDEYGLRLPSVVTMRLH